MKINNHEYTKEEILAALEKKGYLIFKKLFYDEEHIHGSRFIKHWYTTECAIKDKELPDETNQWSKVAVKEFQIVEEKPPLVIGDNIFKNTNGWIKLKNETDLPKIKGSAYCWVFLHGKIQLAIYQSKHFEVKAEFGFYFWDLVQAYQLLLPPEPPLV